MSGPQSPYRGIGEIGGVYLPSARAYTTSLYVMVTGVKGGGHAPPSPPARADFSITMECTPEIGNCHSAWALWCGHRGGKERGETVRVSLPSRLESTSQLFS